MLIQTATLIDTPLDWAVAKAEYTDRRVELSPYGGVYFEHYPGSGDSYNQGWTYARFSTDGSQAVPIIDRHGINIGTQRNEPGFRPHPDFMWHAQMDTRSYVGYGPTLLIAAMRCFVASRLGDKVDVPDQLLSRCSPTTIAALGLASQAANIRQEASRAGL